MNDSFKSNMLNLSKKIEINLSDEQIEKFYKYFVLLKEWNEKINLTSITEENDVILKHFIDSLTVSKYLNNAYSILDVGTGAGFPGIPIAILNNSIEVKLLDSLNKRILFLNEIINVLNLKNVECFHGRAEDFGHELLFREMFDVVVSRAVASSSVLAEYLLPFAKINGYVIFMKGNDINQELDDARFAIEECGGNISCIDEFVLPDSNINRTIVVIKKDKYTSDKYPRKSGLPSKNPLRK